jgi:hypothetical protein
MDSIHRGTRLERGRQVRLSSTLPPHTLPILMIQVDTVPLLLLLQMCCVLRGDPPTPHTPFIVSKVGFGAEVYKETHKHRLEEAWGVHHAKTARDGVPSRFG